MTDGGWTVFMRRYDGSQDFYFYWNHYKEGFGDLGKEHWLGNDKLYYLTNQEQYSTMRMDVTIWSNGLKKFASYNRFRVENETNKYRLHVSGYTGNTNQDHWATHNEMEFSTRDRDNDRISKSCSQLFKAAHWYKDCYDVNPTGLYKPTGGDSINLWNNGTRKRNVVRQMTLKIKRVIT